MTERDKIIQELIQSHLKGWLHVLRPNLNIEIYDRPDADCGDNYVEACRHGDPDSNVTAWLYSHMDSPPPHISKIIRDEQ